jgi:hypothetical protein
MTTEATKLTQPSMGWINHDLNHLCIADLALLSLAILTRQRLLFLFCFRIRSLILSTMIGLLLQPPTNSLASCWTLIFPPHPPLELEPPGAGPLRVDAS